LYSGEFPSTNIKRQHSIRKKKEKEKERNAEHFNLRYKRIYGALPLRKQ
jgi:hypothetical protein